MSDTPTKSIFRTVHNKNFTTVNNTICTDKSLSYKAKGIWLYAFSRPDDWQFYLCDIVEQSADGKKKVSSGLKELEDAGYLTKQKRRDSKNRFEGWDYIFYETPREIQKMFPKPQKADVGKSRVRRNEPLQKTELLPKTEEQQQKPAGGCVDFYECLKELDLTDKEKKALMKHSEQEVKDSIAFVFRDGFQIKTTLIQALQWAIKEKPELPKPADIEGNKRLAEYVESNMESSKWVMRACSEVAAFTSKIPTCSIEHHVKYNNPNFKKDLYDMLKKYQFIKGKK